MRVDWKRYIETNPGIMLGGPVIQGTRITVELILAKLGERGSLQAILESHPHISRKAIRVCLANKSGIIRNEIFYSVR